MIYGYLRVSTDRQDYFNQRSGVDSFAALRGWKIDRYVIDNGVSGTVAAEKRKLGKVLLPHLAEGDVVICSELSRLGRNLLMVLNLLEYVKKRKASLYTVKDNYAQESGGGNDIQLKVLAFAFGLSAEIERTLISQRTREALARKKAAGVKLGRPKGSKKSRRKLKLFGKDALISELLKNGTPRVEIARICRVSRSTIYAHPALKSVQKKRSFFLHTSEVVEHSDKTPSQSIESAS